METYKVSLKIKAGSQTEAEQKLQSLVDMAAVPASTKNLYSAGMILAAHFLLRLFPPPKDPFSEIRENMLPRYRRRKFHRQNS